MGLFRSGHFQLHSGQCSTWKIDCDALDNEDVATLATMLVERLPQFGEVQGIPTGGTRLARALAPYSTTGPVLIVDDVYTTGDSMEGWRRGLDDASPVFTPDPIGAVLFARQPPAPWVHALFVMP